jgi:transcription antitermination factor NusG
MRNPRAKVHVGKRSCLTLAAIAIAIVAAGCSHRVVASPGEHTVKVYPDQATYDKVVKMKSQGGAMGMLGGIGANLAAKEVDDQTPVRIVTSNDEGSVVEVIDGPFKGVTGFVPRQNVD